MKRILSSIVALSAIALVAATAGSGSRSGLLFRGDFERAIRTQWSEVQCERTWSVNRVRHPSSQGRFSARFEVRTGDENKDYRDNTNDSCELLRNRYVNMGKDEYYGQSVLFPKKWFQPYWFDIITQYNYVGLTGPPISLETTAPQNLDLSIETGHVEIPPCGDDYCDGQYIRRIHITHSLSKGHWHDIILHVHWTTRYNGVIELWHRVEGRGPFKKVISLHNIPTMQWREGELLRNGIDPRTGKPHDGSDKIGLYRGRRAGQPPSVLWQDNFRVASSFAAIRAGFPG
jgi:hypothetical protein